MKVIFLQDVPRVAKAGEMKEVADGYGRNFLLPQNLAIRATSPSINLVEIQRRKRITLENENRAELASLAEQLEGKEAVIKARVGAKDRLFGSITAADIAAEIEKAMNLVIDKRKIELAKPIRQTGSYDVEIKLAKDITSKIKATVIEGETE